MALDTSFPPERILKKEVKKEMVLFAIADLHTLAHISLTFTGCTMLYNNQCYMQNPGMTWGQITEEKQHAVRT